MEIQSRTDLLQYPINHRSHRLRERIADMLLVARRLVRAAVGRDVSHLAEVDIPCEPMGSDYGGWVVSTAGLSSRSVVYSFGVGEDVSFDLALIARCGVTVHGFDPTPRSVAWVKSQDLPVSFQFHELGIADFDGSTTFNAPANPAHASYTAVPGEGDAQHAIRAEVRRLETVMRQLGHDHLDILKMDVEGSEYEVLPDMLECGIDVRQLLVEFHHRFDHIGIHETNRAVELLRRHGYRIFSVSPRGEEYSFIHAKRLSGT